MHAHAHAYEINWEILCNQHKQTNKWNEYSTSLNAKHVQNKAAAKHNHNRPRKSRPSDINRKAPVYPAFEKPSEYTVSDAAAAPVTKKAE